MAFFSITNKVSGHNFGVYEADNAADALDALARDAGYNSFTHSCDTRDADEQGERNELDVVASDIKYRDTDAAQAFIATADSRQTSPEIMQAIAFFAKSTDEAVALWQGDGFGTVCRMSDLWEYVTNNGAREACDLSWGNVGWTHFNNERGFSPT